MDSNSRNRIKLIIILLIVGIIVLGAVIASFTGIINLKVSTLIFLIILPVVLMTYFFITSFMHYIKIDLNL